MCIRALYSALWEAVKLWQKNAQILEHFKHVFALSSRVI